MTAMFRLVGRGAVACAALLTLAGCQGVLDDLLEADLPGTVLDETLRNPANAPLLVAGLQTDLHCAFADYLVVSGLVGDELTWADNNTFDFDRRTFHQSTGDRTWATSPCGSLGVFQSLSTARWSGENAHAILSEFTDAQVPPATRQRYLATATIYSAYATLLLGEAMCEATVNRGPRLTRPQMLALAEEKFTTGLAEAQAAADARLVSLARLGRARTRLNLATNPASLGGPVAAKAEEAVADAQAVPAGFRWDATFATADQRSWNRLWFMNLERTNVSVEDDYWQLTDGGVADPRVSLQFPTQPDGRPRNGFDGNTRLVYQTKYPLRNSPMPLARHVEARLIIAEVRGGQTAVGIINELHAAAGLPPFASTDEAEIRAHVIQERARELFIESHHLNDKIRFGLPFTPAAGTPYKITGGGTYGSATCFPLPDEERFNNPNAF